VRARVVWMFVAATALGVAACSSGAGSTPSGTGGTGSGASASGGSGSGGTAAASTGGTTAAGSGGVGTGGVTAPGTGGATAVGSSGGAGAGGGLAATGGTGNSGSGGSTTGSGAAGGGGPATGGVGPSGGGQNGGGVGGAGAVDLFNGTDLTGFNVYKATTFANNAPGTLLTGADATAIFTPENGMIHVYASATDKSLQYHYLLQTAAAYSKYNLSWDYKWGTKKFSIDSTGRGTDLTMFPRDAGVLWQIHGDKTQVWPSAIEFQNKWGSTGDIFALYAQCKTLGLPSNMTQFAAASAGGVPVTVIGGLAQHMRSGDFETPGVGPNAATGEGSDWNSCLLQADNGAATYTVNGHIVNQTTAVMDSSGKPVTSGYIAWQGEQAEVYYRNLRIQVLP
jgi:hypothetical protein